MHPEPAGRVCVALPTRRCLGRTPLLRSTTIALLLAISISSSLAAEPLAPDLRADLPFLRGVVLDRGWPHPEEGRGVRAQLLRLARHGADAVAFDGVGLLSSADSPFVETSTDPIDSLAAWSRAARGLGLRVVFRARLAVQDGSNSLAVGVREARDWSKWFDEYRAFVISMARQAAAVRADLFVVGVDLPRTTHRTEEWRRLIAASRRAFDGPLVYGAADLQEAERIEFWDLLDLVGLQFYEVLARPGDDDPTPRPRPSVWSAADEDSVAVAELTRALEAPLQRLRAVAERWQRPALLTEVGYRSVQEAWTHPRADLDSPDRASELDQRRAYAAMGRHLARHPWLRGALWWGYGDAPNGAEGERRWARGFSPRGKPAEVELSRNWSRLPLGWGAPLVRGGGGVVVSSDSIATRVGIEVLREGGNATDAAVATAFALAVTLPEAGNLGGGGFAISFDPRRRRARALDFRETAPSAAYEQLYTDLAEQGVVDGATRGATAAGIPGTPAGLHALWETDGSLPWERLVRPAVRLALEGFEIGAATVAALAKDRAKIQAFASTREIWLPEGRLPREGQRIAQPELGATLLALEREGPGAFYRGAIARDLVEAVRRAGGLWTTEDLAQYRARWRRPVRWSLDRRGRTELITMGPPSSAGVVLPQLWYFLDRERAADHTASSPDRAADWVEALRLAFADRNAHLADPLHMLVDAEDLLAPSYLAERVRLLPTDGRAGRSDWTEAGQPSGSFHESHDTTHLVVIDSKGRGVSLTTTLNGRFGCGWVAPGTGVLLNNQMDDFDTRPGEPNLYGLIGTGVNLVRPGARMLSSMSPCLVTRDGMTWLGIGGRGGPRILTAVAQILYARVVDDWSLDRAVSAPRLHHQWRPDRVELEAGRGWPGLAELLRAVGYEVLDTTESAKIHAAERTPQGEFLGVADPRERGLARTVD